MSDLTAASSRADRPSRNAAETSISEQLAEFSAGLAYEDIPEAARNSARYLILDAVGIGFASWHYEFAGKTFEALKTFGTGSSAVIGARERLALRDAALMNGVLMHGLDYDDTHLVGVVHPTSSCFPAALAVAAETGRGGRDLLAAYIVGIETAARLGAVAKGELNQVGFHPTGVIAAFATSLVAGHLYGLDARQLVMAQGIALSAAAGTREYSTEGAWTKRFHPGWAAVSGITSAVLARGGFTGPRLAYEGKFGLFPTHLGLNGGIADLPAATADLGSVWEVTRVAIKPFPACQLSIACIDAALALADTYPIEPTEIERIEAVVPPHAVEIVCEPAERRKRPVSSYAAQFSIPFQMGCSLIHRRFGLAELELYRDPDILALADKVTYRVDHATNYPRHFSGEVIVTMRDGRRLAHREPINRGAADHPVSPDGIVRKFMENATLVLPADRAERVRDAVLGLDRMKGAQDLADELAL